MKIEEITGAVVSPDPESRRSLGSQLGGTGAVRVLLECDYCPSKNDVAVRRLVEAGPKVILVDMQDASLAIATLQAIQQALPAAWLLAVSDSMEPQSIIEAVRAGAREYLPAPIAPQNLSEALRRYLEHTLRSSAAGHRGSIYSVVSAKGGSGTTSVAVNLSTTLTSCQEAKIALVDVNSPVGDIAAYLNLKPQYTISDALEAGARLDPMLLESYMSRAHGMAILPAGRPSSPQKLDWQGLAPLLELLTHSYTYSVLDLPCWMDREQLEFITHFSSAVIVVLTPELPALWRTDRLLRSLEKAHSNDKVRLVLNRTAKRDEISTAEIEKVLRHPVFYRLPNNYPASMHAINTGIPLVSVNHSSLAQSYLGLVEKLTGHVVVPLKRRSLLGLFSR
jgi:pilus assembly protein CpaE